MPNCFHFSLFPKSILLLTLLGLSAAAEVPYGKPSTFQIGVAVVPGNWITDMDTDLSNISKIANFISLSAGKYKSFQRDKLRPAIDAASKHGLKVILCYSRINDGDTSLEELASAYGNHPAVIGFKIQDEMGTRGESPEQLLAFLQAANKAIRKHSTKLIMVDVIPWEFWLPDNKVYAEKFPGAKNTAIDEYIRAGTIDCLMISVSERATSISKVLPRAIARWGEKVKIIVRTSASFKGDRFVLDRGSDPALVKHRTLDSYKGGANGIYFYAWQHANHRILNKNGMTTPLFEGMQDTYKSFR